MPRRQILWDKFLIFQRSAFLDFTCRSDMATPESLVDHSVHIEPMLRLFLQNRDPFLVLPEQQSASSLTPVTDRPSIHADHAVS